MDFIRSFRAKMQISENKNADCKNFKNADFQSSKLQILRVINVGFKAYML